MSIRHFIVNLLILSVTYAGESNNDLLYNNFEDVNEGSPWEVKILAALSNLKTEMHRKLDAMDKKLFDNLEKDIPAKLDDLENKLNILGKTNKELGEIREDKLHEQLRKQEKKILEKLGEYIDEKLDLTEKHITRKIDALDKIMADKTDVNIMNHKLDALRNVDGTLANETLRIINEEVNKKLNKVEENIIESENNTTHYKLDALDQKITNLEDNLKIELKRIIPDIEERIKHKLDIIDQKTVEHLKNNINPKLDTIGKSVYALKNNMSCNWDDTRTVNTLTQFINHTLYEIQTNNSAIEMGSDAFDNPNKKNKTSKPHGYWDCKNRSMSSYDYSPIRMDDETLNFVTLESDASGLTRFGMHLAVKGNTVAMIQLSPVPHPKKGERYFIIQIQSSTVYIKTGSPSSDDINSINLFDITNFDVSDFISQDKYTAFHIKINKGTLELGLEGTDSPAVKYSDDRLKAVNYIGFTSWPEYSATFLYDCPPHFEKTIV